MADPFEDTIWTVLHMIRLLHNIDPTTRYFAAKPVPSHGWVTIKAEPALGAVVSRVRSDTDTAQRLDAVISKGVNGISVDNHFFSLLVRFDNGVLLFQPRP